MNKFLEKIFFIILLFSFNETLANRYCGFKNTIKVRGAAFIPRTGLFREIYGIGGCPELEVARMVCNCLEVWGNFDWFFKNG